MGSPFAPNYAYFFMGMWEDRHMFINNPSANKILFFERYIENIPFHPSCSLNSVNYSPHKIGENQSKTPHSIFKQKNSNRFVKLKTMNQEDDLRALAKIMDFLRAVSILFVIMNIYWYCYSAMQLWGIDVEIVDKILINFNRTAALFESITYTKFAALLLLALSCLGTKGSV